MRYYAGVGSRRTPKLVQGTMEDLAAVLAGRGWVLRSGHAPGADQAFERGAGSRAEVYLPWRSFESEVPCRARYIQPEPHRAAYEIAARFHPVWLQLRPGARALHARNAHQVLGQALDPEQRSRFVVCWTPDGSLDGTGSDTGGTGQALRIATAYGAEVLNLARPEDADRIERFIAHAV